MIRGLYAAASGMLTQQFRHEVIAENLANVSTNGYRRQVAAVGNFSQVLAAQTNEATGMPPRPQSSTLYLHGVTDFSEGAMRQTGNPTDLALRGTGFFTVQYPGNPTEAYTRNGGFVVNAQNQLSTPDGALVQGENGPIQLPNAPWSINRQGQVLSNGTVVATLKVVEMTNPAWSTRLGGDLWITPAVRPATATAVEQGCLEGANVNAIGEMINIIAATRQFEANQKCLQAQDATLERAVNDIGRV